MGQAAARYLGSLPPGERERAAAEINRFVSAVGPAKPLTQLTRGEVDHYQQKLLDQGVDSASRLEPLKAFLNELKARKWTEVNLGAVVRVRRKGSTGSKTRANDAQVVELTKEGYEQLQSELQRLETEVLPDVRDELATARLDGDIRENAPYDEAKRRMGEVQGKIDTLKAQLKAAKIVQRQMSTERVGLGSRVVLRDLEYDEEQQFTLVGPGEVNTRSGRISIQSPVAVAVRDRSVGDEIEVDIPSGKARYRIERIDPPE